MGEPRGPVTQSPGLLLVAYRALDDGADGVAIVDADPASSDFGTVLQRFEIGMGVVPHHLYFDPAEENLFVTALDGAYLYRLGLEEAEDGAPMLTEARRVEVGKNQMAEDIWFTEDGSRYFVTFLAGHGDKRDGSLAVFDAETDAMVKELRASPDGAPLYWLHGISGDEKAGLVMVTSNEAPTPAGGAGDSVTAISLKTLQPTNTWTFEPGSAPVEVMLLRGKGLPSYAVVTTMNGGDIWIAPYDELKSTYGQFTKAVEGDDEGLAMPLELYVQANSAGEPELYVTYADPGVVQVYGLDALPSLSLRRSLTAAPGAHHLSFFKSDGKLVVVAQNNLIALEGLDTGTLTVLDAETGEPLGDIDLTGEGMLPESIESAFGHGSDLHH